MLASRTRSSRCLRGLLLLLAGSLLVACAGCLQGSTCYNDDGGIIEDDVPCNPDAEQSFCCGKYWTCLDSGVCSDQNTTQLIGSENTLLARATCTDRTFKSDVCPQFCLGGQLAELSERHRSNGLTRLHRSWARHHPFRNEHLFLLPAGSKSSMSCRSDSEEPGS